MYIRNCETYIKLHWILNTNFHFHIGKLPHINTAIRDENKRLLHFVDLLSINLVLRNKKLVKLFLYVSLK